jgi:phage pi2 protein 07
MDPVKSKKQATIAMEVARITVPLRHILLAKVHASLTRPHMSKWRVVTLSNVKQIQTIDTITDITTKPMVHMETT